MSKVPGAIRPLPFLTLLALLAALLWLSAAGIAAYPDYVWDDSYITYQYGRNLAEGFGLRYNATDPKPTEGFSSPIHVLVVAAGTVFGVDPLLLTRLVSIACFVALPLLLGLLLARYTGSGWTDCAAVAAALQLFWFVPEATRYHLHLGMETFLFLLGVTLLLLWSLTEFDPGRARVSLRARAALGCIAAVLVVLGRPEGVVLVPLSYLWIFLVRGVFLKNLDPGERRAFLRLALLAAAGIAGYFLVKKLSFGHFLPNPYYVKSGRGVWGYAGPLLPGLGAMREFLMVASPAALAAGLLLVCTRAPAAVKAVFALSAVPGLAMVVLYTRALQEAAFHFRFIFPYLVYIHVSLAGAVCLGVSGSPRLRRMVPLAVGGVAIATVLAVSPAVRGAAAQPIGWMRQTLEDPAGIWWVGLVIGKDLARSGLGQRAAVATSMAGAIPWYSGMRLIDLMGLVTDELSGRESLTPERYWRFVESERPDVLISGLAPASAGYAVGSADPALDVRRVAEGLRTGAGSEMSRYGDRRRMREMAQREMIFIREHYFLGSAIEQDKENWVFIYVRRDSPLRHQLYLPLATSAYADNKTDLARFYRNDPRSLPR